MKKLTCPACGSTKKFYSDCATKAEIDDGELNPLDGKLDIDPGGLTECVECGHTAPTEIFQNGDPDAPQTDD